MQCRRCAACAASFRPRPQAREQRFCSRPECQRERRRRWQKNKRQRDADYRENQRRAQRNWAERHGGYWREYRARHPQSLERNRVRQRERDRRRRGGVLAKMDVSMPPQPVPSGIYEIRRVTQGAEALAKMDVWRVQLAVLPTDQGA